MCFSCKDEHCGVTVALKAQPHMADVRVHRLRSWRLWLIASEPTQDCDKWQILVTTSSNGTFTIDLDSGVVEPFAPNASLLHVTAIAADPSRRFAFFADADRKVIWRSNFNDSNEVIYELPSGDIISSVMYIYSNFSEGSVSAVVLESFVNLTKRLSWREHPLSMIVCHCPVGFFRLPILIVNLSCFLTGSRLEDIEVDPVMERLFYADRGLNHIAALDYDGSNREMIVLQSDPVAIVLQPETR